MEVGKDYVIVAHVFYTFGKRQEIRIKKRLPPANAAGAPAKKTGKPKQTEELVVAGKKLLCEVELYEGKPNKWFSAEVPFDGLVKQDSRNVKYILTDFGRAKSD